LDTNGIMTTLFTIGGGINGGGGVWGKDDEAGGYFCFGTGFRKRVSGPLTTGENNFNDLGKLAGKTQGDIIATDRGANKVYLVNGSGANAGARTRIAGNGTTNAVVDGTLALTNGLFEVRGVWLTPNGGYLLATHAGSQVLYVDAAGLVH